MRDMREAYSSRENSRYKGSEVAACLICLKNNTEANESRWRVKDKGSGRGLGRGTGARACRAIIRILAFTLKETGNY